MQATAPQYINTSYAGTYKVLYFPDYKQLAIKTLKGYKVLDKKFPLSFRGGVYNMAQNLGM